MARKKTNKDASGGRKPEAIQQDEPYVVLARKYRPRTFDDLIGQDAMVATLRNAFASGRIAQGYMLTGVRGVGKTTTARILARALNFDADGAPDGPTTDLPSDPQRYGRHCAEIMESRHPDVLEMDAASNTGVDNIRELIESARYKPLIARYKVFIIDEVHMLSKGAFNALLKTLEEPPEHVKFIFATTEIRKVPVTILSRCQRFDLRRVDVPQLSAHFAAITQNEGSKASDDALNLIARAAEGSVRDGLSILDQAIAFSQGEVSAEGVRKMLGLADRGRIFDLLDKLFSGDAGAALEAVEALNRDGAEPLQIISDLAETVHVITRIKTVGERAGSEGISAEEVRRAAALADSLSIPLLARAWQMLLKGYEEVARAPDPGAATDMVLIRIAYTSDLPSPDEVIKSLTGEALPAGKGKSARPKSEQRAEVSAAATGESASDQFSDQSALSGETSLSSHPAGEGANAMDSLSESEVTPTWDEDEAGLSNPDFDPDDPVNADMSLPLAAQPKPDPGSFIEVVELVGSRRDAKMKVHLEEHVSLVKFDAEAGSIDLYLLPGAPKELANNLREKLNRWTGRRWVVVLSKSEGQPAIAEVRRNKFEKELAQIKDTPAVKAVLGTFPDAKIAEVRPRVAAALDKKDQNEGLLSDGQSEANLLPGKDNDEAEAG